MKPSDYQGYEVLGLAIGPYLQTFRQYPSVGDKYLDLTRYGVARESESAVEQLRSVWIPMEVWLAAMHALAQEIGSATVFSMGRRVAETAPIPPHIDSIAAVLSGIDVVYHNYHRKNGVVMFDPLTGTKMDGIGNYSTTIDVANSCATATGDAPYPCDLDRGIFAGFAGRFEPAVSVTHVQGSCRKKGDSSCNYLIQW